MSGDARENRDGEVACVDEGLVVWGYEGLALSMKKPVLDELGARDTLEVYTALTS